MKELELISENELDEFIASVQANKKEDGNKMAIKKQSNLYARMKQLEFEIKEYIKKFAGTTAFDPCEFGKLNTEYFNLRFKYDNLNGKVKTNS